MEWNATQCNIQHVMVSAVMEHFIVLTSLVSWKVTFVVHFMGSHGSMLLSLACATPSAPQAWRRTMRIPLRTDGSSRIDTAR